MCRPCQWVRDALWGARRLPFDLDMLRLAILFRREAAKANDEDFRKKAAAFDGRDALRDEYEQAKIACHKLRQSRRELEMRLMRHGIPLPQDEDDE